MQRIKIDFDNPGLPKRLDVMENDAQSRFFEAELYRGGKAYSAPSGATYSIMYHGFGPQNEGWYDTINDGAGKRAACTVSGNVVTCELARQALQVPGHVSVVLAVTTAKGYIIKSWPIDCNCRNDNYDSTAEIEGFFYITQITNEEWGKAITAWEEFKNMIDPTLSISGKAADAAKVGEAVNAEAERAKGVESQIKEDLVNSLTTFEVDTFLENKYIGTNGSLNSYNGLSVSKLYRVNDKATSIRIDMNALSGLSATIYISFYSRPTITSIFYVSGMKYTEISSPNINIPSNAKYFAFCWKTSKNKPKIFQNGDVKEYYSAKDIINECLPIEQPSTRYSICLVGDSITQGYGSTGYQQYTKEIDGKKYSIRGDGPDNPLGVQEGDLLYENDTRKWYESRSGSGWGQKLKSYIYECYRTSVRNFGMTGVNSSDVLNALDNFLNTKKYTFDAFVVMVGTNDRGINTKIQFYNNLTDIVKKIQGNGKPVILMSALPASSTNENIKPYHMLDVNNIISKVSSENNVPFISFFNLITEYINISSEKLEDLLLSDGLHPNDHGYDVMLNELLKSIGLGMKK